MSVARALVRIVIVAVVVLVPMLVTASSPCMDCDGVCGAAVAGPPVAVPTVLIAFSLAPEAGPPIPPPPLHRSELPPRPLRATV